MEEWLNLLLRWTHLITGIAWIGSSFYFMWLDSHLAPADRAKTDVEGELWMVHSGGFYLVERKRIGPGTMPAVLHWFKFEALFTWITGFLLLNLIYYFSNGVYLIDPAVADIGTGAGIALGLGALVVSWFVYDWILLTPLARTRPSVVSGLLLALGAMAVVIFCQYLSGRAAFIHFGAMLGTIMVANVWVRILPSQQKMIDATKEGRTPDFTLSAKAKQRSVHNSYMTFPVLFMMVSNHYGNAYGHAQNWIVLLLLMSLGMSIRHVMIAKSGDGKSAGRWAVVPAVGSLIALVTLTSARGPKNVGPAVSFNDVRAILDSRCTSCHSPTPKITQYGTVPGGTFFETPERVQALAERIKVRAVTTKTMPMQNATQMTDAEREILGRWIDAGAPINTN